MQLYFRVIEAIVLSTANLSYTVPIFIPLLTTESALCRTFWQGYPEL